MRFPRATRSCAALGLAVLLWACAAGALRNVADDAVVPALVAALKDPNHWVGSSAAHSLARLAGPEAIPALEELAKRAERKSQADAAKQAIERIKRRHP